MNLVPLGAWTVTLFHLVPFQARATGVEPPLLRKLVPTAKHDFGAPHEIWCPLRLMGKATGGGTDEVADRAMDGVTTAEAVPVAAGTAVPVTAASATSPDMTSLRTRNLSLGIPNRLQQLATQFTS
jgi:hypothetical protein